MKYIESLIWGFIVALTALILEVFCEIIIKDILGFSAFTFQYTEFAFPLALLIIFLVATIEESLKFTIFWKRTLLYVTKKNLTLHGGLLGSGFALTELILFYYKNNHSLSMISIWQITVVFLTHIILGILLIYSLSKIPKNYIFIMLLFIIILHAGINIVILSFLR
ncbi:MAG: hypothetical protein KAT32_00750 [Candidatus Moranbacteria bacterium]|nr:hypothetical protein [Candidatus Moranbacteria bacterium]